MAHLYPTRIKVCGITRYQDVINAQEAGADAFGMIFQPSAARYITPDRAAEIRSYAFPFVTPVGVFADADCDTILEIAARLSLETVQLNGGEQPEFVRRLRPLRVLKAVRVDPTTIEAELCAWRDAKLDNLAGVVLEPAHTGLAGGSGITNDWTTIRRQFDKGNFGMLPFIVAGGLTPETVGEVVRTLRPWAVDVSSGVEESKGIKSATKVEAFISAVREADCWLSASS